MYPTIKRSILSILIIVIVSLTLLLPCISPLHSDWHSSSDSCFVGLIQANLPYGWAQESLNNTPQADIQWFKDQLRISPKYTENRIGILGMSWALFFTIVFLAISLSGALLTLFLWKRKTNQIVLRLIKEMEKDEPQRGKRANTKVAEPSGARINRLKAREAVVVRSAIAAGVERPSGE